MKVSQPKYRLIIQIKTVLLHNWYIVQKDIYRKENYVLIYGTSIFNGIINFSYQLINKSETVNRNSNESRPLYDDNSSLLSPNNNNNFDNI